MEILIAMQHYIPICRSLSPVDRRRLRAVVAAAGGWAAAARALDLHQQTMRAAVDGRRLQPRTVAAIVEALGRFYGDEVRT